MLQADENEWLVNYSHEIWGSGWGERKLANKKKAGREGSWVSSGGYIVGKYSAWDKKLAQHELFDIIGECKFEWHGRK